MATSIIAVAIIDFDASISMLRKRAKPSSGSGGGSNKQQHEIAFDHGGGGAAAISAPKLFVPSSSGEASPEAVLMSPTSTLQTASATSPCSGRTTGAATAVPFSRRRRHDGGVGRGGPADGDGQCRTHRPWDAARPVGLGLVGALNDDDDDDDGEVDTAPGDAAATAASSSSSVLTGQIRLRVQTNYYAPCTEFGVKSASGAGAAAAAAAVQHAPPPRRRWMSPREMMEEMSEDYTCVIARGANPRTTHIFDNRVVESSGDGEYFPPELWPPSAAGKGDGDFLRYCHGCSKDLGPGKDIFMYRGEKAFCSHECRYHEMLFDEGIEEL
uniref:FLZ-type domain-containing protein n=1 Tax=Oryza meridionalis TaxID=40149 RepID=A0A0E0EY31_9ORYZ